MKNVGMRTDIMESRMTKKHKRWKKESQPLKNIIEKNGYINESKC